MKLWCVSLITVHVARFTVLLACRSCTALHGACPYKSVYTTASTKRGNLIWNSYIPPCYIIEWPSCTLWLIVRSWQIFANVVHGCSWSFEAALSILALAAHETHILACLGVINCPYRSICWAFGLLNRLLWYGMAWKSSSNLAVASQHFQSSCCELSHTVHRKYLDLLQCVWSQDVKGKLSNTSNRIWSFADCGTQ